MKYRCVGCDQEIAWDGEGMLCITCKCGATIFYKELSREIILPASLILQLVDEKPEAHLDRYVGSSSHMSPLKEGLISVLKQKGFIWMSECEQCRKDGTIQRYVDREKYLAVREAESILRTAKGKGIA